jgi:Fe2+ transport system protein B
LLSRELGLPVVKTSALHGKGVKGLVDAVLGVTGGERSGAKVLAQGEGSGAKVFRYSHHVEQEIGKLETLIESVFPDRKLAACCSRYHAIKAIECPDALPAGRPSSGKPFDGTSSC